MSAALPTIPVLHSEWIKMRSLRGTLGALIAIFAATAGIQALTAAAIGQSEAGAMGDDPLLAAFYGINFGQVAAFAFGASALSAEFHNGALRTSLSAVPNRTRFYLSKIAMVGGLAFVVGQITGWVTFVAGQAFMGPYRLDLGAPGTVRAIFGSGLYLALMALFAAGLTAVLRNATAVLSLLIPFVLMVSFVIGATAGGVAQFLPDRAGQIMMRAEPVGDLGPWTGLGVAAVWVVAALIGGWLAVRRRDA
ncbi:MULTISPECIES: ABC transporter permease [unclassified Streptomyces]|uniref:ABC transporter permease n=1 Tax=unclassified Streptomyces TaxID=2593676 RepID=UPI001BE87630|nr:MULTISPECIES: ABC transporter permease [unclassified Streptomyces]MBT2403309.1 ABC transporter permease [Streptomyces sp. ISL-21]MBT2459601.1 ABC transporter permease [Streptomyces sp. ISL-86]MBT2609735.1 ABC transporter permease [Streptomyces sp. ISL-87]